VSDRSSGSRSGCGAIDRQRFIQGCTQSAFIGNSKREPVRGPKREAFWLLATSQSVTPEGVEELPMVSLGGCTDRHHKESR
jgi:hypothetical protein